MLASNKKIKETLEATFPKMKAYELSMNDPDNKTFNFFIYGRSRLRRTSPGKYMQVITVRAVLYPDIPDNFELDVIKCMEDIKLVFSQNDEISYDTGLIGTTDQLLHIVDIPFLRPFQRLATNGTSVE